MAYQHPHKHKRKFVLYWSNLTKYEDCGQKFLWSRGWGDIDVGGGPGRKKPLPVKPSRHHAIMGIVMANFWEWLYNDEEWKHPSGLTERLLDKARKEFSRMLLKEHVDWRLAPDRDELWETIENGIKGYLRTMRDNKLLGPFAESEMDLTCYIDKYTPIGGKADLIFRRSDTGITILDGKNSRRYKAPKRKGVAPHFMTHTDPDQLRWYALCFFLAYKKMPSRLGFVYFRYPSGAPRLDTEGGEVEILDANTGLPTGEVELETGVDWVPFTREDLKGIALRAKKAVRGMNDEKFEANPVPSQCRFCDYQTICPERIAQRKKNSRNRKKSSSFFDGQFDGKTGVVNFGMGPGGSIVITGE